LLWGRKWDVELWRLDDAREAKEKKERIIIKSERNGFIFDRQFAGIWMYAWVVDFYYRWMRRGKVSVWVKGQTVW